MQIAVLDGRTLRKFINLEKKLGGIVEIDRPSHKRINDKFGNLIFSALKYSTGWDCRIATFCVSDLKSCF